MGGILDKLDVWLRGLLIEGITGNMSGMFDTVNTKVGEIAGEVGQTPLAWNSGVFSFARHGRALAGESPEHAQVVGNV